MHNSTLIVLVILTIGQMFMMAFGAFILWLMGDLGDTPRYLRRDGSSVQGGKDLVHVPQEAVTLIQESPNEVINSGEEGSIAPKSAERGDHEAHDGHGHAAGKAA